MTLRDKRSTSSETLPLTTESPLTRRGLLKAAGTLGALSMTPSVPACGSTEDPEDPGPLGPETTFQHGVASGDPLPDGIILWTRISPATDAPVRVTWQLASDPDFRSVVDTGTFTTSADRDFTVKVDVGDLAAATTYYYRFKALRRTSPVGRTRTAPSGQVDRLRFAVVSCSSYAHGYFHSYRRLATELDLDAILHLGDYIYEYPTGGYGNVREYEPENEILTLGDYRTRHSLYKRDPDLQAVHRQHPFITVWDDHESANDAYKDGAQNHNPMTEGVWAERKAAAQQAYAEWMPIRDQEGGTRVYRKLGYGSLVDIVMLDTRLWARTKQEGSIVGVPPQPSPTRTLLGDDQEAWLRDQLDNSQARWRLIGQQVMVGNLVLNEAPDRTPSAIANLDQWHGYPESRARFLDLLGGSSGADTVVLTGDIHSSWANDLVTQPSVHDEGRGSLGVEFVTPAVTSPGLDTPQLQMLIAQARVYNPHVRWFETVKRGYLILDVTEARVQGAWFLFDSIDTPDPRTASFASAWSVARGQRALVQDAEPAAPRSDAPAAAPV
jgi:alkaline phosphatase D